jgi:hypothetical protein
MPVETGLVCVEPWGVVEWVRVDFGSRPGTYRILYNDDELFWVMATEHQELLDKITAAWRLKFPQN